MMTMISRYVDARDLARWCVLLGFISFFLWSFLFTDFRICTTGGLDEGGGVCGTRHGYLNNMPGADLAADVLLIGGLGLAAFGALLWLTISILDRRRARAEARERETVDAE